MADDVEHTSEKGRIPPENADGHSSGEIQRVALVSSSPSVSSIIRVVVIVLLLLAVKDVLGALLSSLTYLLFMVVLAVLFAYLMNPLVNLLLRPFEGEKGRKLMPRPIAIALSFLIVFSILGLSIWSLAPRISEQARAFIENVPTYTTYVQSTLGSVNRSLARLGVSPAVQNQINERFNFLLDGAATFLTTLFGLGAVYTITILPWLILVPVLAFFFLKDAQLFRLAMLRIVPAGTWRVRADAVIGDVNSTLIAYTRAQIISCVLIGVTSTIGFYIIGHNYALILGVMAGVLEIIPILGPLTVAVTAVIVASFESGWQALTTLIFLGVLRLIHDYYTYPRIVREGIHLHPLAVILSVLAGEQIAGIAGVFIAIPLVALATVIYKHVLEHTESRGLVTELLAPKENKEIP